jgi:S-DNA-T family DNA segregation ATPase FtsK/SpoIIIE
MLEVLPHVGSIIPGDDAERLQRLLRMLKTHAEDRADRYAKANAATIVEYRERANQPDEPRLVILVDGVGSFRTAYEGTSLSRYWDMLQSLAADGRALGIHFVISADRPGAVSSSLSSSVQRRLVLRLSNEMDYVMVDAPSDGFAPNSPPGRGFLDGDETQVAVFSGDSNVAVQAEQLARYADSMRRAGVSEAPPIQSLPEFVPLSSLPATVAGAPTFGIWDETLEPIGFPVSGTFLVSGPPSSGKTSTVATMVKALVRAHPALEMVYLGTRRSPLASTVSWSRSAVGPADIGSLASELSGTVPDREPCSFALVIEGVAELLNTDADLPVQDLLKACRVSDQFVIAEGETSTLSGSWPLLQAVKASRTGIVLQPDQMDGDALFKTPFPRVARADFPQGRGLLASGGSALRVQVAVPE